MKAFGKRVVCALIVVLLLIAAGYLAYTAMTQSTIAHTQRWILLGGSWTLISALLAWPMGKMRVKKREEDRMLKHFELMPDAVMGPPSVNKTKQRVFYTIGAFILCLLFGALVLLMGYSITYA